MTTEQVKQLSVGEWVSIAPEVRPSITKNADGSMKPFYVSRVFKYSDDGKFTLQMINSADAYGKVLLVKIVLKGRTIWQGEHPIAADAQKIDYIADEEYEITPLIQGFADAMNHNAIDIRFEGSKFYPSKLKQRLNIPIEILAEYGVISSYGRYKGQPSPYGMGLLEIPPSEKQNNLNDLFQEYCIKLLEWKDDLKECGVDEIIIDIANTKDSPMDISFSNDTLHNLSSINARVELHLVSEEEEEEEKTASLKNEDHSFKKDELYQKVMSSLKQHPFINKADAIPYFIYFYSTKYSESIDENLTKFEDFYKEAIKH